MVTAPLQKVGLLGLDAEELVTCVSCGLCLPHCPTYRATGFEIASPRGRIAAMVAVEGGSMPADATFDRAMQECVQCRACESACPASVPFGHLMEDVRAARSGERDSRWRAALDWIVYRLVLPRHVILIAATWLLAVAQRLHLVPARLGAPSISLRSLVRPLAAPAGGRPDVWIFTGCVMDAWLRDTHRSALRVMDATGARIARPGRGGDCCGALHVHAGRREEAKRLARRVIRSMPGDAPIVVDSAGCGAELRDYGHLLGTPEAHDFARRVRDFAEWLSEQEGVQLRQLSEPVVVQDPCHLRHVQGVHEHVSACLAGAYDVVATDDDGMCCGAGGTYSLTQPDLSSVIRARKIDALRSTRAGADPLVASANPGCLLHLRAAGIDARHPADLIADALEEPDA